MPDGTKSKTPGTMTCRSLGGLWLIGESIGGSSEASWSAILTIGFDPTKNQFVGTYIGSMMSNIWPYHGVLNESGKHLPLESFGPKFVGEGSCKYVDTIAVISENEWHLSSQYQADDGSWVSFMVGKHVRA